MTTDEQRGENRAFTGTADDESFVTRWSRRKRQAAEADESLAPGARETSPEEEAPEPPVLTDEDMPPVESITDDADVSGFLSAGVSESLRRQALRRLFAMPKFQIKDGLDDYDGEYRNFTPLGDTVTSDMKLQAERRLAGVREEVDRPRAEEAEPERPETDQPIGDAEARANEQRFAAAEPRPDGETDGD